MDQPLYQLGLDTTLKNLLLGSARSEAPELPPARGVDSIRNAAWASTTTMAPAQAPAAIKMSPTLTPAAPPFAPAVPPAPRAVATAPAIPIAAAPTPVAPTAPPQAAATTAPLPQAPVVAAAVAPEPVAKSEPASIGISMDHTDVPRAGRDMGFGDEIELDAASPRELGASEKQGALKHLLTQAVLWTVQIEEPGRYTLGQAWVLLLRSLRSAFAVFIDPIEREIGQRWGQAREDWRTSGETVAKQKTRKRVKPVSPE